MTLITNGTRWAGFLPWYLGTCVGMIVLDVIVIIMWSVWLHYYDTPRYFQYERGFTSWTGLDEDRPFKSLATAWALVGPICMLPVPIIEIIIACRGWMSPLKALIFAIASFFCWIVIIITWWDCNTWVDTCKVWQELDPNEKNKDSMKDLANSTPVVGAMMWILIAAQLVVSLIAIVAVRAKKQQGIKLRNFTGQSTSVLATDTSSKTTETGNPLRDI